MKKYPDFFRHIPNICTLLNVMCGIMALMISVFHKSFNAVNIACVYILIGAFFDGIDGRLARKLGVDSQMGKELDSFADVITFGIAPICVFLSMHSVVNENPVTMPEIILSTCYIVSAVFRLARYNVSDHSDFFVGLPTTCAGMFMGLYIFIANNLHPHWQGERCFTVISYGLIVFLAVAMVSTVKVNRI